MRRALAADLGGTKLSTAVITEDGGIVARRQSPVDKADVAAQIAREADACLAEARLGPQEIAASGLIVPGIFNPADGHAWAPNLWGDREVPLGSELAGRLPPPIRIDSDRSGYVVGEAWLGAARGLTDVIFLAVGTGIGAGILAGGRVLRGAAGIAGSVGWFALSPDSDDPHYAWGCWEAESAGPGIARRAGLESAEAVMRAARAGDGNAQAALDRAASFLAMGIANLISAFNPQMIVLGGGVMQSGLLLDPLRRLIPRYAQPRSAAMCRVESTQLANDAGLFGAARLALCPGL
jgi:glucokinase